MKLNTIQNKTKILYTRLISLLDLTELQIITMDCSFALKDAINKIKSMELRDTNAKIKNVNLYQQENVLGLTIRKQLHNLKL